SRPVRRGRPDDTPAWGVVTATTECRRPDMKRRDNPKNVRPRPVRTAPPPGPSPAVTAARKRRGSRRSSSWPALASGSDHDEPAAAVALQGDFVRHRCRLSAGRQLGLPELLTGLDVEGPDEPVDRSRDEGEPARGDDGAPQAGHARLLRDRDFQD